MALSRTAVARIGLGLLAGAVLPAALRAQIPTDTSHARRDTIPRRDSVRVVTPAPPHADTLLKKDSTRRDTVVKRDTIKAPIARAEAPVLLGIGPTYQFDRAALFATGAATVADLLDRIPGATTIRSGWIAAPMVATYLGAARHIRFFYDGLELDDLDPANGGVYDLSQLPLWTLEDIRIERGATELRVYMRSWRVDHTTPYTRVDATTGDQQTNLYRGFFGKRYPHGEALQIGLQQYGTTPDRGGSSDQLTMLGRVGVARAGWTLDAFALRASTHRGVIYGYPDPRDSVRGLESSRIDAYVRAAWGDPDAGPWIQALAGALKYHFTGDSIGLPNTPRDTTKKIPPDTGLFRAQYVLTGGWSVGALHLSAAARERVGGGTTLLTPSGRASFATGPLGVSLYAEGKGPDSLSRAEGTVQFTPLPFVSLLASAGRSSDSRLGTATTGNWMRAEAGLRLPRALWLSGGIIRRDTAILAPPRVFDTTFTVAREAPTTGLTAGIRGTIWKDVKADVVAIRWTDSTGFYRPQYETRSEVYLQTNWLSRFPSGNLGILVSVAHQYRSNLLYPTADGAVSVGGFRTIAAMLQIRILSADVFYQFRNAMGEQYYEVPGLQEPRQTQLYGVRWDFWN